MGRLGLLALACCASMDGQTGAVQLVSLTPPGGSGGSQTFDLTVSDTNGAADIASVGIYFAASFNGGRPADACLAYYDTGTNRILLSDDAGIKWISSPLGNGPALANHQ